ncbi:MAG: glutamate-1-semialdehyde-2,1-aminomutase [Candidatus Auribacter fodinae]|jgi:glutamate-1-semialdehyde 2,1-aminomutase|uniref:Glutamate-1-semialdehyde 2,1-aminomutase n=1 Tax=Candidatus Auribacter fodinae TaxID=2093366 RepID=A0A3A4QYX4_9BACT|nr:MAG: glutamate-1-semialdehyde-2,1-aminomutase [Candidatus Auribacter fodinae]
MDINKELYTEALKYIPGGVNSPVRSFQGVGGTPVFFKSGAGSHLFAEDDTEYIDYCQSWGALLFGHAYSPVVKAVKKAVEKGTSFGAATRNEVDLARMIVEAVPSVEQVRLTCSGTEAVMSAVRLARAYTGKNTIIKFAGSYHGHCDYMLVQAGSGAMTLGIPDCPGVPESFTQHTVIVPYNDADALNAAAEAYSGDLAAIILEPVAANCGVIVPDTSFLSAARTCADTHDALLIFDEVITGFRLAYGGAQEYFGVMPDLTCMGKIIGGGLPVGAFGGKEDIMSMIAPAGPVYQAGTLSGNPVAVSAGLAVLRCIQDTNPYTALAEKTALLRTAIQDAAWEYGIPIVVNSIASLFTLFFTDEPVERFCPDTMQNTLLFSRFFHTMLEEGIYLPPSGFEAQFVSMAHTDYDIERTVQAVKSAFSSLHGTAA